MFVCVCVCVCVCVYVCLFFYIKKKKVLWRIDLQEPICSLQKIYLLACNYRGITLDDNSVGIAIPDSVCSERALGIVKVRILVL